MTRQRRVAHLSVRSVISAAAFTTRVLAVLITGHAARITAVPGDAVRRRRRAVAR